MNQKTIIYLIVGVVSSVILLLLGTDQKLKTPQELYRVYLGGRAIGLIESKHELENYIDKEQQSLKEVYQVDKVYAPKDLDIVKETTFNGQIFTTSQIYDKIKDISPFTVNGYTITIEGVKDKKENGDDYITPTEVIYVLDKQVFVTSVDKTIRSFIPSNDYDAFLNETQTPIKETGTGKLIEDIYIENNIIIQQKNIPVDQKIFTAEDELSRYLLFGTLDEQRKYTVKNGDTIEDVAFNNKISPEEFLIANPNFTSVNSLLYEGQQVTLGVLQPKFRTVEEDHKVEIQERQYKTEIRYNNDMLIGQTRVIQKGQNGSARVTQKIQSINGEMKNVIPLSTDELVPVINEVIERGGRSSSYGDVGFWGWPTNTPYTITSPFGYRWGVLHDAVDIAGTGYGSPIYSANNGVIITSGYTSYNGNYIIINHNNGYYTYYGHLSKRYVKEGDNVELGMQIGEMGNTGYALGTHVHFGIWRGRPYGGGSVPLNPLNFY